MIPVEIVKSLSGFQFVFLMTDIVFNCFFIVEIALRVSASKQPKVKMTESEFLTVNDLFQKYMLDMMNIIDFLSVAPFIIDTRDPWTNRSVMYRIQRTWQSIDP